MPAAFTVAAATCAVFLAVNHVKLQVCLVLLIMIGVLPAGKLVCPLRILTSSTPSTTKKYM
jgi:hypothetical protein